MIKQNFKIISMNQRHFLLIFLILSISNRLISIICIQFANFPVIYYGEKYLDYKVFGLQSIWILNVNLEIFSIFIFHTGMSQSVTK